MRIALACVPALALLVFWASPVHALDSAPWERVLRAHARRGGVDYAQLSEDPEARADLERFLQSVASMPQSEPLSAWINAYNAVVVSSVLSRWPLRSVQDVPGFFDRARHRVAGAERTLNDIENEIIRVRFPDARVHAALNCGAQSCPPLHGHAFTEATLDATLDRLVRAWLASDRHLSVADGRVRASAIFEWYAADFRRDGGGSVVGWIRRYAPARVEGIADDAAVTSMRYDWSINAR